MALHHCGLIEEIDEENLDLKCQFLYLGATPVDLEFNQVEKIRWQEITGYKIAN